MVIGREWVRNVAFFFGLAAYVLLASAQVNEYDALGRLTKQAQSNGPTLAYRYDAAGNIVQTVIETTRADARLAAWYTFDDCTATDRSGNGNHGSVLGTVPCEVGASGKAMRFGNGTITVPNSASLTIDGAITIVARVNLDPGNPDGAGIIQKGSSNRFWDYGLVSYSQAPGYRQNSTDWITWPFTPNPRFEGSWHVFAVVVDESDSTAPLRIYVDGMPLPGPIKSYLNTGAPTDARDALVGQSSYGLEIGVGHPGYPLKGLIDDIKIYRGALSATEVYSASGVPGMARVAETGITQNQCFASGSSVFVSCDSMEAKSLNEHQDGMRSPGRAALLYADAIAPDGTAFPRTECVADVVTGLWWESKTLGGPRDVSARFHNLLDGSPGDIQTYVAAVNASGLCGRRDWRVPTADELHSVVNYDVSANPMSISGDVFPIVPSAGQTWSSSRLPGRARPHGMFIDFRNASLGALDAGTLIAARLVSGPIMPGPRYVVQAGGAEVLDETTGLIWRRCIEGMSWNGTTCAPNGQPTTYTTIEQALLRAGRVQSMSPGKHWRLPNVKELSSIVKRNTAEGPASIDGTYFPNTPITYHWTSTPLVFNQTDAYGVYFGYGSNSYGWGQAVRLVRDR